MELPIAVSLLQNAAPLVSATSSWADLGCGAGLFSNALARLLPEGSKIYAVDNDGHEMSRISLPAHVTLQKVPADFEKDDLPFNNIDGILMANSLHFVEHKRVFIHHIEKHLKPNGAFLIVEYDMDTANPWVPYPVSFTSLQELFNIAGYNSVVKLSETPSSYNKANIYSALIQR